MAESCPPKTIVKNLNLIKDITQTIDATIKSINKFTDIKIPEKNICKKEEEDFEETDPTAINENFELLMKMRFLLEICKGLRRDMTMGYEDLKKTIAEIEDMFRK